MSAWEAQKIRAEYLRPINNGLISEGSVIPFEPGIPRGPGTIQGYEAIHMIRKGQVRWVSGSGVRRPIQLIEKLFELAARDGRIDPRRPIPVPAKVATLPRKVKR